jgi:ABC-2 type transport system permease protein
MSASLTGFEWTLLRRDRRAWWALLCLGALVLIAFAVDMAAIVDANAAKADIARAERARWLGQGEKDPHSAAHYSIFAFKPTSPLAALDLGVEPFVGQTVWLEAHVQNDMLYRPQGEASALQRAGLSSPASLLIGFAPLVAFLLAFTAVAMDRERGTLRLALGAALRPREIVASKAAAIWLALVWVLVVPVTAIAAIATAVLGALDATAALRLVLWAAAMAVYLGVLTALGLAVSMLAGSVRGALAVLFGLWIAFGLALPRWANSAVESAQPLPSTQTVKQQLLDEAPSYWTAEDAKKHQATLLAKYGAKDPADLRVDLRGAELDLSERHSHEVFDRVLGGFYDRVVAQDRAYAMLGWLSPTAAMQSLSPMLAGSDFVHHRRFIDGAERYRRALVNRMNQDVMAHPTGEGGVKHTNDASLWAQIPEFHHPAPSLSANWRHTAPAAAALLAWSLAALALLALAARRLRP